MATKYLSSAEDGFEATDEDGILKPKNSEEMEFGDGELEEAIADDEDSEVMA